jgi:predicted  nucleic acid-binding Zn-ribbon protein
MSVVAKILIVLNLVLAVVFLGAASTFLGEQQKYKLQFENVSAEFATAQTNWEAQKAVLDGNVRDLRDQLSSKTAAYDSVAAKAEAKEAEFDAVSRAYTELRGQFEQLAQTARDAQSHIEQLNSDKNNLVNEKDQAMTEKRQAIDAMNDAITERRRLEGELVAAMDTIAGMEKVGVDMAAEIEGLSLLVAAYKSKVGDLPNLLTPPKIKAKVSAVNNEMNIVILSVGRDDQVEEGFEFTIYRGNDYVGKVIIDTVEADYCSGHSKKELERLPISSGDDATTVF